MVLDQKSEYLDIGPYLSNLARYWGETFKVTFWGSTKLIQDVKDDHVLQELGQDPSTSSKYDQQG